MWSEQLETKINLLYLEREEEREWEREGEREGEGRERERERAGRGEREREGERGREGKREGGERGRERGERGGREGGERGERGGERENLFLLTTFFSPYNLIMGELFSSSILPQLQDRGLLLFLTIYVKNLLSSDWLR